MKKNKMMRIAAVLLIVTLLSTCAISGTFAKYVAKADLGDSARVAKWGIKIETGGKLFKYAYEADDQDYIDANYEGVLSVDSRPKNAVVGDNVVAPGTKCTDGFYAKISGKPEVATRFKLELGGLQDIFMPFGKGYTDYSEGVTVVDGQEVAQTFDLEIPGFPTQAAKYVKGYSPVKWDVEVARTGSDAEPLRLSEIAGTVAGRNFKTLYEAMFTPYGVSMTDAKTIVKEVKERGLEGMIMDEIQRRYPNHEFSNLFVEIDEDGNVTLAMDFGPGENCNYTFTGGWAWEFEQTKPEFITSMSDSAYTDLMNQADTYLGNVAAGIIDNVPAGVSKDLTFNLRASATQID